MCNIWFNTRLMKTKNTKLLRLKRFLIHKYGLIIGTKRFKTYSCTHSERMYIFKFGKCDGIKKYKEYTEKLKPRGTLPYYIKKYGEVDGTKKYKEKNRKLSVSEESLRLNGYSEDDIKNIKNIHSKKSSLNMENCVRIYGADAKFKIEEWKRNRVCVRKVDDWVLKKGKSLIEATELVKKYQSRDLNFFICKYGDTDGKIKWREYIDSKMNCFFGESKSQLQFSKLLYMSLSDDLKYLFRGCPITNSEVIVFEDNPYNLKYCVPDVVISNIIIEFDGEYWHNMEHIKERDIVKEFLLQSKKYVILRVKEKQFKKNITETIEQVIDQINTNIKL